MMASEGTMTRRIRNESLEIGVDSMGAELSSLRTSDGHEYLWPGSTGSWTGRSPILFPIIGGLPGDSYFWKGRKYEMNSHGFARKSEWEFLENESASERLVFELTENESTLEQYPFPFRFRMKYTLNGASLAIDYDIVNTGNGEMPFSVGAHPGFRCPIEEGLAFSDYRLRFDGPVQTLRHLKEGKLLTGKTMPFELKEGLMPLNHDDFINGAIILRDSPTDSILLESEQGDRSVRVDFPGFPDLGIWTFPDAPAPYICIEPWYGVDSTAGTREDGDFATKSGMMILSPGERFKSRFTTSVN